MFSTPVVNSVNDVNGLTKEEELGLKGKQKVIELSAVNEEHKENYLNSYFETLNLSTDEPDWSQMIIRAMEFHDFTDCKSLLDMIDDREFVFKYKHELEGKFEELVTWFLNVKLGISSRPIPPFASDNRMVDLLGLYVVAERDVGYRNVTNDNLWPVVAKDMGYEYHDGEFMRIIYAMYLDVLVIGSDAGPSEISHERRRSDGDVRDEEAYQHYSLFAGNDWEGVIKMQKKRRRFDFNQARKAVNEANRSVLMYAAKHNQV
ncbi:putative transcription factor & chromatin remodeling ARID family [Helianthus anomalus]